MDPQHRDESLALILVSVQLQLKHIFIHRFIIVSFWFVAAQVKCGHVTGARSVGSSILLVNRAGLTAGTQ